MALRLWILRLTKKKEKEKSSKEEAPPPLFQMDKSLTKKEETLPSGLRFGSVESINMKAPSHLGTCLRPLFSRGICRGLCDSNHQWK